MMPVITLLQWQLFLKNYVILNFILKSASRNLQEFRNDF